MSAEGRAATIEPALLSDDQAASLWGVSVRKFHEQRQTEAYVPAPVVLGPRCLKWVRDELIAAIAMMPRAMLPHAEPLQLLKSKTPEAKALRALKKQAKTSGTTEVKT